MPTRPSAALRSAAAIPTKHLEELFVAHNISAALRPFLAEYLRNGRVAATAYCKTHPNASPTTGRTNGHRWLLSPAIRAFIMAYDKDFAPAVIDRIAEMTAITKAAVLQELGRIGFANIEDFCSRENGSLRIDPAVATRAQLAAVRKIKMTERQIGTGEKAEFVRQIEVELYDKRAALVDIGTELGMFVKVNKPESPDTVPPEVQEKRQANQQRMLRYLEQMERGEIPVVPDK